MGRRDDFESRRQQLKEGCLMIEPITTVQ